MASTTSSSPSVVVLGGGFSGTMTAVHLLRTAKTPLVVHLVEKTEKLAMGTAFGTGTWAHLLNVPAARMGAMESPDHFLRWLSENPSALPPGAPAMLPLGFAPRRTFGTYLRALLEASIAACPAHVTFMRYRDEALDVEPNGKSLTVSLAGGATLSADRLVLALGNFPPRPLVHESDPFRASPRYINDPWATGALDGLTQDSSTVLLVGTGLTMIDVALVLRERRPRGTMIALSRRGFLPHVHRLGPAFTLQVPAVIPRKITDLLRWIRKEVVRAAATNFTWQAVVDALRPHSQGIWQALPLVERRRFLRHARVYWDTHRHRIAPEIADRLASMRAGKNLSLQSGRLEGFRETSNGVVVSYCPRGHSVSKTLTVSYVVNCTGPDARYAPSVSPLVSALQKRGLVQAHALGLGLDGLADGRLFQQDGSLASDIFAIGPARQPILWETTAVPELRDQAAAMAALVLESLASASQSAPRTVLDTTPLVREASMPSSVPR